MVKAEKQIELFAWFRQRLEKVAGFTLPETPGQILRQLDAPDRILHWADLVENGTFAAKMADEGESPDLESRKRHAKRKSGQFYTPESFAREIIDRAEPALCGKILDPACGDGSFLLAAAEVGALSSDRILDRIFGYDVDNQALLVCLGRLLGQFWGLGWPHLFCANFLTASVENGFSLIVGNPPYKVNLNEELKEYLHQHYQTAEGEKDLYTFFIERSVGLLDDGGQLILLTSHTWMVNHQCRLIREFVFKNRVKEIFLLPSRFFANAPGVLPIVLHLKKGVVKRNAQTYLHSGYSHGSGWKSRYVADQASLIENNGLRQAILPDHLKQVFKSVSEKYPTISQLCRVGVGIQESVKREGKVSKFVSDTCLGAAYRPVLKGRELAPMKINWEGKFIHYGPHLAYAGDETVFEGEKILYQNIRNEKLKIRLVAVLDRDKFYPKNSISFITAAEPGVSLAYVEALLNSVFVNAWFSGHYHSFHITVSQVKTIPIALPQPDLVRKIALLASRIKELEANCEDTKKEWQTLNRLVCEAYLGPGEHQQLLEDCYFFLEQAAAL